MRQFLWLAGFSLLLAPLSADETTPQVATIGQPAPDFTMTGIDGQPFKLSQFTDSGKNVALIFSRAHW